MANNNYVSPLQQGPLQQQAGYFGNFAGQAGLGGLAGALGLGAQFGQTDPTLALLQRQREQAVRLTAMPPPLSVGPESPLTIRADGVRVFATFREELQHEVDKWLAPAHR